MKTYVDWAVKHDFSVIDVNLPKHISDFDYDRHQHEESDATDNRTREATQLLTYLWDNYIELNEATQVFFMGTNTGHGAIINFIKGNEERTHERLTAAISFVEDVPLQSCKSATNDLLASWYYSHSLIFVTPEHSFWSNELSHKPRKRFGRIQKSSEDTVTEMLIEHKETVFNLLLRDTERWRESRPQDDEEDEMMETTVVEPVKSPSRMPPIGNFAPSLVSKTRTGTNSPSLPPTSNLTSPRGARARSPRIDSPPRMPPLGNFALSPRQRTSKSPGR